MLTKKESIKKYFICFACCGVISAMMLGAVIVLGNGIFLYAGDFNQQQIPFQYFTSKYLHSGGGTYSWATDLGSSFVNSYSFYTLGSPFFWLSSLFPPDWMPYLMYPLLVLKFAVMGGGVQLWAKRYFHRDAQIMMIACLYITSGYAVSNIFFNHFIDVMALFPYLLWALDLALFDHKKGVFPVAVACNFLVNYFFFFGETLFLALYLCAHLMAGNYRMTKKTFFSMAWESLLGCAMGGVLAFPAFFSLAESPRAGVLLTGWGFLIYRYTQQYIAIILNAFFAPDRMFSNDLWTTANVQWTSMSLYIPGISLAGVLAYLGCRKGKRDAWKNVLLLSVIAAWIPGLNAAFTFLNAAYYARWYYMPLLILCAMTVQGLGENAASTAKCLQHITLAAGITGMLFAVLPVEQEENVRIGLIQHSTAIGCVFLLTIVLGGTMLFSLHRWKQSDHLFWKKMLGTVCFCGILFGGVHTCLTAQYDMNKYFYPVTNDFKILGEKMPESPVDYRMDYYTVAAMNQGLWTDISNVKAFNSTVEPSLLRFYRNLGYDRSARLEIGIQHPALYTFLNVKYHNQSLAEYHAEERFKAAILQNEDSYKGKPWSKQKAYLQMYKMPSIDYLKYRGLVAGNQVYENTLYAGMGFQYDTYISQETFDRLTREQKEAMLLKSVLLSEQDIATYGSLFQGEIDTEHVRYSLEETKQDAKALKKTSCRRFKTDNNGFSAEMDVKAETIAVFSIPFSDNWTVTINGEKTECVQVDGGMLGIHVPSGHCKIRGDYHTKFAKEAWYIAVVGWMAFSVYLIGVKHRKAMRQI